MTKMKKTVACLLLALALCLVSIAGLVRTPAADIHADNEDPDEPKLVGIFIPDDDDYLEVADSMKMTLNAQGVNVNIYISNNTVDQSDQINKATELKVNLIYVVPVEPHGSELYDALYKAAKADIPVVVFGIDDPNFPYVDWITWDFYALGLSHAESITDNTNVSSSSIIDIYYPDTSSGNAYLEGVRAGLVEHDITNFNAIVASTADEVYNIASQRLRESNIDEIRAFSDSYAVAALDAYLHAGYSPTAQYSGTGIGAISSPSPMAAKMQRMEEIVVQKFNKQEMVEKSCDLIMGILNGEIEPNSNNHTYLEFVRGYVWYVEK